MKLSPAQRTALEAYSREAEAPDYADYADRAGPALGWLNRERVIIALERRALIKDGVITALGRKVLGNVLKVAH